MSPFDRADWFNLVHAHAFAAHPRVTSVADAVGTAVRADLYRPAPRQLAALAHWYSFHWRPVFDRPAGPAARDAALLALAHQWRGDADRLTLAPVPDRDGTRAALTTALRAAGWAVFAAPASVSHWLDVAGLDFAAYWAERPGRLRSTVARKGKAGRVACHVLQYFNAEAWDAFETIYAASWKPAEDRPALLRAFAMTEGAAGRLRLGIARIDGQPVAAQFWTVENGVAYIHKLAHLPDSVAASPGTLLSHALFAHVIDTDRVHTVDFGTGDDGYKRDWMNRRDLLWRIDAYNPTRPAAWPGLARAVAGTLKRKLAE